MHVGRDRVGFGLPCARREIVGALVAESAARLGGKGKPAGLGGLARDALEDLLDALAAVYGIFPDLWLDPELR